MDAVKYVIVLSTTVEVRPWLIYAMLCHASHGHVGNTAFACCL